MAETETPKRERPTMARIRELETALRTTKLERDVHVQREQAERTRGDDLANVLSMERQKWADLDPQAKAIGQIVPVLNQLDSDVRGARWAGSEAEETALAIEVAETVANVLTYLAARYGVVLEVRS